MHRYFRRDPEGEENCESISMLRLQASYGRCGHAINKRWEKISVSTD